MEVLKIRLAVSCRQCAVVAWLLIGLTPRGVVLSFSHFSFSLHHLFPFTQTMCCGGCGTTGVHLPMKWPHSWWCWLATHLSWASSYNCNSILSPDPNMYASIRPFLCLVIPLLGLCSFVCLLMRQMMCVAESARSQWKRSRLFIHAGQCASYAHSHFWKFEAQTTSLQFCFGPKEFCEGLQHVADYSDMTNSYDIDQ